MARSRVLIAVLALVVAGVATGAALPSSKLPGLMTGKGPWGPNDGKKLKARLDAIGLDPLPREAFKRHIHQRMAILVNEKLAPLPARRGIARHLKVIAELHTHDSSGIMRY